MISTDLPRGLRQAFRAAAGELGHAGAAEVFLEQIAGERGEAGVISFRDQFGSDFPVADAVAMRWLGGWRPFPVDAAPVIQHLMGIRRLLVVGMEARHMDALLDALPEASVGILTHNALPVDWNRVIANGSGRLRAVELGDVSTWAGSESAIVCFIYGDVGHGTIFAPPGWLRLNGPDVHPQFRSLIGWNVLPVPFAIYPRWFHEVQSDDFTAMVNA